MSTLHLLSKKLTLNLAHVEVKRNLFGNPVTTNILGTLRITFN